jgi:dTDP-4-dehydrorhamnose reductase
MTWLVVGCKGQLGRALSVELDKRGIANIGTGFQDLDIRSQFACRERIVELAPTVIINAAAWTDVDGAESDPESAQAVNTAGAVNLALAAKTVGAVFAHISTDYVFSGVSNVPWLENDQRAPVSVYGKTKAAGELGVLNEYKERSYIFRTAWLYGTDGQNFVKTMIRLALSTDHEVRVVEDQLGQPTSASDLANQIIDSVLKGLPFGIYHATNSGQSSWFEFAQEIFVLCGQSAERVIPVTSSEFVRPAKRPSYSVLGHGNWKAIGSSGESVPPMRDWRLALNELFPAMFTHIRRELAEE